MFQYAVVTYFALQKVGLTYLLTYLLTHSDGDIMVTSKLVTTKRVVDWGEDRRTFNHGIVWGHRCMH